MGDEATEGTPGLYLGPVLIIDPGVHVGIIKGAAADREGRWAVTGSFDKTVRIWSLTDGGLARTIRLPAGPGNIGKVYAVAMSPDGKFVAAGGSMRWTDADPQEQIYLFDRVSGALSARIEGLRDSVNHIAFSSDGGLLAVTTYASGLHIFSRDQGWTEIAQDEDYCSQACIIDFAADGRFATTAFSGEIRLYGAKPTGNIRPSVVVKAPSGDHPFGIAFNPNGKQLAVGYYNHAGVDLLDELTLASLPGPDLSGIEGGDLCIVAWSRDGRILYAAGQYSVTGKRPVLAWKHEGLGARRSLAAQRDLVTSLVALPGGDLLVASAPELARLRSDGRSRWVRSSRQADFRDQFDRLSLSSDGTLVDFGFEARGRRSARFDVATHTVTLDPPADGRMAPPRQDGLPLEGWRNGLGPTHDGGQLPLGPYERSRSLAIHPAGSCYVLGTDWNLRAFDSQGMSLWNQPVLGSVWAVNVSGDGRLVVAAYGDGTIRWHRMADGTELLAFMPLPDKINWVAWTPEGFHAATPGAHGILRWHVNHGWDAPAGSVSITDIPGSFRPAVLPLVLRELETPRALGLAVMAEHRKQVANRTHSHLSGAQLHVLTIGISAYNDDYAKSLRLNYAHRDAHDLASALVSTQEGLYARVTATPLLDQDANKTGILSGLLSLRSEMERGGASDLAVIHFAGHGAMLDGELCLLPYDIDPRDPASLTATSLSIGDFQKQLLAIARFGRVLVLLDACHSGAASAVPSARPVDAAALRRVLAADNVTVLTSSAGTEVSREDPTWQNGAFTRALLDALHDPTADMDKIGLINTNALAHYVSGRVRALTDSKQTPAMEVRFDSTVFSVDYRSPAQQNRSVIC